MLAEYIKALILGIIEGITEWLPVSSTGHLIIFERLISLSFEGCSEELKVLLRSTFDVVIQFGAILAVLMLYGKRLLPISHSARMLWLKLAVSTLPAGIIGIGADIICEKIFGKDLDILLFRPEIVASTLIVYGILFILIEHMTSKSSCSVRDAESITFKQALAIGFFQSLAIIPGTSRSGATVIGARMLGIGRSAAAEFSFFAAIPVIGAASALKTADIVKYASTEAVRVPRSAVFIIVFASIIAFAVSLITIKFLTAFVKKHSFAPFGVYRIALGIIVLLFVR